MKIRTRLALLFAFIAGSILLLFSLSIYYLSSQYREKEFYIRLRNKAITTAQLLIEVKEVDKQLLNIIEKNTVNALYHEKIAVYDYRNKLIFHHEEMGPPLNIPPDVLDRIRLKKEYHYSIDDTEAIGLVFEQGLDRFVVIAAAADVHGITQMNYLKIILMLGLVTSVIIALISGWLFARQMLTPISNVIAQVGRITASNLGQRVHTNAKKDEIAQLSHTFNDMLERLESAFEMQKRFLANASHELRTPLTAITGQLEVTLRKKRGNEEYEQVLRSILDDVRNLSRLTNGLLALAQAKADASEVAIKSIRVDELLWETREELLKAHPEYRISIDYKEPPQDEQRLMLPASQQLLKIAIANLMDNACKFSDDHTAQVLISCNDHIILEFRDKGKGIPKEEIKQVFQPFFRGSNVRHIPGNGLGLPLTDKIVRLYKGKINVTSIPGKGTNIQVIFPAAF